MKRYLKPVSLMELSKAWKVNELPILPNKHRGKQLYLRLTSEGELHKQGGGSYVIEDDVKSSDVIIIGTKRFKLEVE